MSSASQNLCLAPPALGDASAARRGIRLALQIADATIELATTDGARGHSTIASELGRDCPLVSQVVADRSGSIRLIAGGAAAWFILVGFAIWVVSADE